MCWEVAQGTRPGNLAPGLGPLPCAVLRGYHIVTPEGESAQSGPLAVRSRTTASIWGLRSSMVGWFARAPWCHSIVWHCLVVSLHLTPQGILSGGSGVSQPHWDNWGIGVCRGWRLGRVGRKCLPHPWLFSGGIWAWPWAFQTEVSVGGQNLAGGSIEL